MIDRLLANIAPYPCISCTDLHGPLCDNCKYDIVSEPFAACISCGVGISENGLCSRCRVCFQQAWCVGQRSDALEELIDRYKFYRLRSAHIPLADMMAEVMPRVPLSTVVVPIPTISKHIRQRGYDHAALLAKRVARTKNTQYSPLLLRNTHDVQHNASRRDRIKQAKVAFRVEQALDSETPYLLLDDIVTTGSTMKYAAQALYDAGARIIWVAAVARQGSTD